MNNTKIGLHFLTGTKANLTLWAPLAKTISIKIINKGVVDLEPTRMGLWQITNLNIHPGDNYHILIDGKPFTDPASLYQPKGVHEASQAFNLNDYSWTDRAWKGIPLKELIIYELHTGTFTPEGTFDGIAARLDYLKDLGINAIEIMPVSQFPGSRNWGYDGVYPFAVQSSYGGPERLQHLVDTCHQKGMAVILDVVYNHLGPEGNYLPGYGPVFTDKYKTPWGQAINFDDEWSDGVRKFFIDNALMWFRDFHIDGLRLDAVHAIKDFGSTHILRAIKAHVNDLNKQLSRHHFLICESDLNDIKFISPFEQGGYDLDATWCDEFHHALHSLVTGEINGYYADFGDIDLLVKSMNNAFVFDGTWSPHRKRYFGNKTTGIPGHRFVVFTQNHDQVGNRMMGDRLSTLINWEMLKVVAGTLLVSPFTPLLFMGEEYAETHPFLYFTSHTDENLIRLVREGRRKEFKAFMQKGETPDPHDTKTFNSSKLNWERSQKQQQMFSFYKELIHLRKTLPALRNTNRQDVLARRIEGKKALSLIRKSDDQSVIVILNFEPEELQTDNQVFGKTSCRLLLNSSDEKWGGPANGSSVNKDSKSSIPGQSITLWVSTS